MAHSVTMRTTELRRLLRSVSVFADQSKSALPVLNAVLLRGHGDYITATATDRYRLACQRVRPESLAQEVSEEIHALLPLVSVKAILQAFKSTRRSDPWAT